MNDPPHIPDQVVEAVAVPVEEGDDDDPDVAILVVEDGDLHVNPLGGALRQVRGRNLDNLSSLLFDMLREECPCSHVWSNAENGCRRVVQQCQQNPEQAFYTCPHSGRIPLHEACLRGCCRHVIRALLDAHAYGRIARDHFGNSPLHLWFADFGTPSLQRNDSDDAMDLIVGDLLALNPAFCASTVNAEGCTPLHMACMAPEARIPVNSVKQLLAASPAVASKLNSEGHSALALHCKRHRQASVNVARILLSDESDSRTLSILGGAEGWSPLHYAAANCNLPLLQFLLQLDPSLAKLRSVQRGQTALHVLCQQTTTTPPPSYRAALEALLEAAPETATWTDRPKSLTPLHWMCKNLSPISLPVVQTFLEAAPQASHVPNGEQYLPLHYVCDRGIDSSIVNYLLKVHPEGAAALTRKQDTALSLACSCNQSVDTVRLLIQANPKALLQTNDYGFAPLHCVCRAYQPRLGIVKALLDACPHSVLLKTHGGETPAHLASSCSGTYVGVLQLLTTVKRTLGGNGNGGSLDGTTLKTMTNKVGNTPLHDACFRWTSSEHIETLAMSNPEWIMVRNNAGYTPFQVLCKNGRVDEHMVATFSKMGGPEIFSVVDPSGITPLHSVMREGATLDSVQSLIRVFPDALHLRTTYGDMPLHLACFRRADAKVVREVAIASSNGKLSPLLVPNNAGQTPMSIAIDEFQSVCRGGGFCCVRSEYKAEQTRSFEVLAALVKIFYYGPSHAQDASLVQACVSLHRQDVRLDPAFIRRAIHLNPEEAGWMDESGSYPLHTEASIPVEKMSLLDASVKGCCSGACHQRMGILRMLVETFPEASKCRNDTGDFPVNLMVKNGRAWGPALALALREFPQALHWYKGIDEKLLPYVLERIATECGTDTLYTLISSRPDMIQRRC